MNRLNAAFPDCWTFAVDGLIGATPELLVRRSGDRVTSRVLAGTVHRSSDAGRDGALAAALLSAGSASAAPPSYYPADYQKIIDASRAESGLLVYSNIALANWAPIIKATGLGPESAKP